MKFAKFLVSAFAALCFAAPVVAQPIHDHPQKAFYVSPAEWPTDSSQCHWHPGNTVAMPMTSLPEDPILPIFDPQIAHTHLDCTFPRDAELGATPFEVSCVAKLFHTAGRIGGLWSPLDNIKDVVWADTGTSTPNAVGDPMGVKQWNVKFTFVPDAVRNTFPPTPPTKHGWSNLILTLRTAYDNGDRVDLDTLRSYYSVLDRSVPEAKVSDEGILNGTRCAPNSMSRPELNTYGNQMGVSVSEYVDRLPLGPIQTPWNTLGRFYTYAALEGIDPAKFQFPDGGFEQRFGVDIHNGIPGTTVAARTLTSQDNQVKIPVTFSPTAMGSGTKNVVQFWRLPDGQGNDVTALYVITLTVGPGIPQPTTCQDPLATNLGGALPCTYPTVPTTCEDPTATNFHGPLPCTYPVTPVVTWVGVFPGFERQFINNVAQNVFRFCVDTECFTFPVTPVSR